MRPRPDQRTEREDLEPHLLGKLPTDGVLVGLSRVHAAAGSRPADPARELEAHEQHAVALVEDERPHRIAEPRFIHPARSRRARNQRSRSFHETAAFAGDVDGRTKSSVSLEHALLQAVLGSLAEHTLVGGLSDEADGTRPKLCRDRLEPLAGAFEVGGAEVSRAAGRPARRVRQPHSELEKPPVLARLEETGREAGSVEQAPEVVPRVRERRPRGCAHPARVDSAEDDSHPRREDIRDGRLGQAASARVRRGEARAASAASRRSPPRWRVAAHPRGSTFTESSSYRQP